MRIKIVIDREKHKVYRVVYFDEEEDDHNIHRSDRNFLGEAWTSTTPR